VILRAFNTFQITHLLTYLY